MKELLKEVFFNHMDPPESIEGLSIEGLFDVIYYIETKYKVYLQLENKPSYGHHASFHRENDKCVGMSGFCEFRLEALEGAINNFLEK